jgi:hypothetical protein
VSSVTGRTKAHTELTAVDPQGASFERFLELLETETPAALKRELDGERPDLALLVALDYLDHAVSLKVGRIQKTQGELAKWWRAVNFVVSCSHSHRCSPTLPAVAQEVQLGDAGKPLSECTLGDIEARAAGAASASIRGDNVSLEARYATLAEEMKDRGADGRCLSPRGRASQPVGGDSRAALCL